MGRVYIEGAGQVSDVDALKKLTEHEVQIASLESTIRGHEDNVCECKRQIEAIRKMADPIRKALIKRIGGA